MPYNPGVQDISGQLLAGGLKDGTKALLEGYQQYKKNKDDSAAADAAFDMLVPYAQQLGVKSDTELLAKFHKGGLSAKNAMLGQLTTNITMEMRQQASKREQERLDMERVNNTGAAAERNLRMDAFKKDKSADDELNRFITASSPASDYRQIGLQTQMTGGAPGISPAPMQPAVGGGAEGTTTGFDSVTPDAGLLAQFSAAANSSKLSPDARLKAQQYLNQFSRAAAETDSLKAHGAYYRDMGAAKARGALAYEDQEAPEGYVYAVSNGKRVLRPDRAYGKERLPMEQWMLTDDENMFKSQLMQLPAADQAKAMAARIQFNRSMGKTDSWMAQLMESMGGKKPSAAPTAATSAPAAVTVRKYNPSTGRIE